MRIDDLLQIQTGGSEALAEYRARHEALQDTERMRAEVARLDEDAVLRYKECLTSDIDLVLRSVRASAGFMPADLSLSFQDVAGCREVYRVALQRIDESLPAVTRAAIEALIAAERSTAGAFTILAQNHERSVHQAMGAAVAIGGGSLVVQESPLTATIKQWSSRFFWAAADQEKQLRELQVQPLSLQMLRGLYPQFVAVWEALCSEFESVFARNGSAENDAPVQQELVK